MDTKTPVRRPRERMIVTMHTNEERGLPAACSLVHMLQKELLQLASLAIMRGQNILIVGDDKADMEHLQYHFALRADCLWMSERTDLALLLETAEQMRVGLRTC